jgi:hypothetical protein
MTDHPGQPPRADGPSRSRRPSKTRSNPSCSCTFTRAARSTSTSRSSKTTDVSSLTLLLSSSRLRDCLPLSRRDEREAANGSKKRSSGGDNQLLDGGKHCHIKEPTRKRETDLWFPLSLCPRQLLLPRRMTATRSPLASVHQRDLSRPDLCRSPPLRLCLLPHPRLVPFPPSLRTSPNPLL